MSEQGTSASGKSETYAFALLYQAASFAFAQAKERADGRSLNCLQALLDSAFCLEAFLNHLGEHELALWTRPERKSSHEKLKLIVKRCGFAPDFSKRPYSTFDWVFSFRDDVVHARTEVQHFTDRLVRDANDLPIPPTSKLMQSCNLEVTSSTLEDVRAIISEVAKTSGSRASLAVLSDTVWATDS